MIIRHKCHAPIDVGFCTLIIQKQGTRIQLFIYFWVFFLYEGIMAPCIIYVAPPLHLSIIRINVPMDCLIAFVGDWSSGQYMKEPTFSKVVRKIVSFWLKTHILTPLYFWIAIYAFVGVSQGWTWMTYQDVSDMPIFCWTKCPTYKNSVIQQFSDCITWDIQDLELSALVVGHIITLCWAVIAYPPSNSIILTFCWSLSIELHLSNPW